MGRHARTTRPAAHRSDVPFGSAFTTIARPSISSSALMEPPAGLRYVQTVVGRVAPHARRLFDGVIALGLALLALIEIWWPGGFVATGPIEGNTAILVSTALAMTLPLAFRRRFPLATVLVVFGAAALQELLATSPDGVSGVPGLRVAGCSVAA